MSLRIAGRAREWLWGQPGRARAALSAAVVVVVAGGAVAVFQPDDGPPGRTRHDRGVLDTTPKVRPGPGGTAGEAGESPSTSLVAPSVPGGGSSTDGSGPNGSGPAGAAPSGGSTTTGSGADNSTTTGPGGRGSGPAGGTPTSPAGGGARSTSTTGVTDRAGWEQIPRAPIAGRESHTAVWTGREMVVWGGSGDPAADPLTDGAAFDPAAGTWRKIAPAPLTPRSGAQAVWTGSEMLVFGGSSVEVDPQMDGAAWNPATNAWRRIAAPPISVRDGMVIAWTGDRLVVWGGATVPTIENPDAETVMHNDGAAWVAASDRWITLPAAPLSPRSAAESVWTGTRLVVSGGYNVSEESDRRDGAAFDPASGTWSPIAARPTPGSCAGVVSCSGVWTGSVALFPGTGLAYDPAGDRWTAMAAFPAGDGRLTEETAVWTGGRLLVWGESTPPPSEDDEEVSSVEGEGEIPDEGGEPADDGGTGDSGVADEGGGPEGGSSGPAAGFSYDPARNGWQPFAAGPLAGRQYHSAVWTGREMLIWGGYSGGSGLADGAAYRPAG